MKLYDSIIKFYKIHKYKKEYLSILGMALGLDHSSIPYKNHHSLHLNSSDFKYLTELESYGYVKTYQRTVRYVYYYVTDNGKKFIQTKNE